MKTINEKMEEIKDLTARLKENMREIGMMAEKTELPPRPYIKSKELFMDQQNERAEKEAKEEEDNQNFHV